MCVRKNSNFIVKIFRLSGQSGRVFSLVSSGRAIAERLPHCHCKDAFEIRLHFLAAIGFEIQIQIRFQLFDWKFKFGTVLNERRAILIFFVFNFTAHLLPHSDGLSRGRLEATSLTSLQGLHWGDFIF